jgi:hypothetical protein
MLLCVILTLACISLATREVGQLWGGFAFNAWGQMMKANETDFVFFDSILAVAASLVQVALRTPSPVAWKRATTVFCGFATGFLIPVGGE